MNYQRINEMKIYYECKQMMAVNKTSIEMK